MNEKYEAVEPTREAIKALEGPTLLEIGSPSCGHCSRAQALIAEALEGHDGIRHIKIADGKGQPLGRSFAVTLWPTLIFLSEGVEVSRVVRPGNVGEIEAAVESLKGQSR